MNNVIPEDYFWSFEMNHEATMQWSHTVCEKQLHLLHACEHSVHVCRSDIIVLFPVPLSLWILNIYIELSFFL